LVDKRNSKKAERRPKEKTFKVRWIYQSIGISKQAYSQRLKAGLIRNSEKEKVIAWVIEYRKKLPKTGTCKLYEHLAPILKENHIKMGRNGVNDLLRNRGMLVKKTKRFHITTDSKHFYYKSPNLLTNKEITHSEQVFVSDITYVKTDEGHAYLALVTDAYSRKIMGWSLENNMKVSMVKDALEMAYKNCTFKHENIIHHSDRGIQYCCPDYTQFTESKGFILSTTQQYDPYENAIAERINGILKYEFGLKNTLKSIELAKKMTAEAVTLYNNERMHWSLDFKKPQEVHLEYNLHPNKNYKKEKKNEVKSNLKT
jgi:putative transposase